MKVANQKIMAEAEMGSLRAVRAQQGKRSWQVNVSNAPQLSKHTEKMWARRSRKVRQERAYFRVRN